MGCCLWIYRGDLFISDKTGRPMLKELFICSKRAQVSRASIAVFHGGMLKKTNLRQHFADFGVYVFSMLDVPAYRE